MQSINDEDIMYQDNLVCILKPHIKKGVLVWTRYNQPENSECLCEIGLKTGKKLKEEGIDFGRIVYHPYHFFRAPYCSNIIDYNSIETEINSLYGKDTIDTTNRIFIRVDPEKSYVFSSEIRAKIPAPYFHITDGHLLDKKVLYNTHSKFIMEHSDKRYSNLYNSYYNNEVNKSKKTLSSYLKIIKNNELTNYTSYNLYTSKKVNYGSKYPFDYEPIEKNSEILVSLPHLTKDYFVDISETKTKQH